MEVFCFRLYPNLGSEDGEYQDYTWIDCNNGKCLSSLFATQVNENNYLFGEIEQMFESDPYAQRLQSLRESGSARDQAEYSTLRRSRKSPLLDVYISLRDDLFPRDEASLSQEGFNVDTYVILLTNQGQYAGHVYAWIPQDGSSAEGNSTLYVMGIRKNIPDIIEGLRGTRTEPITRYLFEGARILSVSLGKSQLGIVSPYDHMVTIIEPMGFRETEKTYGEIGISPATHDTFDASDPETFEMISESSKDVYILNNLSRPLTLPSQKMNIHLVLS